MLEEAVEMIRKLWEGDAVTWRGTHYRCDNARIFTRPEEPPPILVSGFGEKAIGVAARIGDGFVTTSPNKEHVDLYTSAGGTGLKQGGLKVCWGPDEAAAEKLAHELWPNAGLEGELSQELPMPAHFEQASANVTPDDVAEAITCGPDPERHRAAIQEYLDAGFDEVYVSQVGPDQQGFLRFYTEEVLPHFG
jgi:G6PDH family F420-dependent oxidoreductase